MRCDKNIFIILTFAVINFKLWQITMKLKMTFQKCTAIN
jgi:hypothetical protein